MEHFKEGTEFHTYKELLAAKFRYEQDTKTLLTTKKSAKYGTDDPRYEDLVYSRIQYQCKAGQERKSTSKGNRAVSSSKMNCPVVVTLSVKEGKLCVVNAMLEHQNHTQDYETFMKYPENLRLKPNEIKYAKKLLTKGYNKKTIRLKLKEKRGGMPVAQKFWTQIHKAMKKSGSGNENSQDELQGDDCMDFAFDTSPDVINYFQTTMPEIKVKQEFHTGHNTSDDDTNDDTADPLSEMFDKCVSDDEPVENINSNKYIKVKKDFDDWFKDLIPGERLSYNEWLWHLEFNFPSIEKLNFIKYGIILGMTILNKYYFDSSLKIDGNGIKEVGTEFSRKRKRHSMAMPMSNVEDKEDDENDDENDDTFDHEDEFVSGEAEVRIEEVAETITTPTSQPPGMLTEPISHTSKQVIKSDISESTQSNQPNEPINCKMCPEIFPTHSQLYHHMCKMHTGHIGLNCPICNKRFQYERNLNQHIASVHVDNGNVTNCSTEEGRSICEICGASFDKMSSLKSHSRYVHSIEKFYCQYCNRKLSSKKSLKEHIQFQHELTFVTHSCEDCQRIFKYKSSYRLHMRKQHGVHFG